MKSNEEPLSLRFTLMKTYSFRLDSPLVPVLYVRFPYNSNHSNSIANSSLPNLNTNYIDIIRILDPEHREPFISLGRLLLLCKPNPISPIKAIEILKELNQNLIKNEIQSNYNHHHQSIKPIYSLLLNGLAPFPDLWVNLKLTRLFSNRFGLLNFNKQNQIENGSLANLLNWNFKEIWSIVTISSVKEPNRIGELVSNWRIPEDVLPLCNYSLTSLEETSFDKIEIRPKTIGEDELLRLPIKIPNQTLIKKSNFKSFPDTLLSEICLISSDYLLSTQTKNQEEDEEKLKFKILKSLESLGSLILNNYLDLDEFKNEICFKDQIDSLGILLFSIWKNQIIQQNDQNDKKSNEEINSNESEISSLISTSNLDSKDDFNLNLERIENKLELIEIQLEKVLLIQKNYQFNKPIKDKNQNQINLLGIDFFMIHKLNIWIWISLIGLAYVLGRIQGNE